MIVRLFDDEVWGLVSANPNLAVPWYIMAAYAYYVEDNPILRDHTYDRIAQLLAEQWGSIEHFHKSYLDLESVQAQTYLGDYPRRSIQALRALRLSGHIHDQS